MSSIVLDAIAADLATITPVIAPDPVTLGWGRDLSCVTDLQPNMAEIDPLTPTGIGEAAIRRITTPRGSLPDDRDYGIDVRSYLSRGVPAAELRDLAGTVKNEIAKDDRIEALEVAVSLEGNPVALHFAITIYPALPDLSPFDLIFVITDGAVAVERMG